MRTIVWNAALFCAFLALLLVIGTSLTPVKIFDDALAWSAGILAYRGLRKLERR